MATSQLTLSTMKSTLFAISDSSRPFGNASSKYRLRIKLGRNRYADECGIPEKTVVSINELHRISDCTRWLFAV